MSVHSPLLVAALLVLPASLAFPSSAGDNALGVQCPFNSHASASPPTPSEVQRARTPSAANSQLSGATPEAIADRINTHVQFHKPDGMTMVPCSKFDLDELNSVLRALLCHSSGELSATYPSGSSRARRFGDTASYERAWAQEIQDVANDASSEAVFRDAKCAEAQMLWAHHLTEEGKHQAVSASNGTFQFPTLPTYDEKHAMHPTAGERYTESLSCVSGHNQTSGHTSDHVFPHWPAEVHYHGMGHGAYPFWLGGGGSGGDGAPIEVWYSETKSSEKFYHTACSMTEAGYSSDVPCVHLFVGGLPEPKAYLYTATEDFCCISSPTGWNAEKLAPPPSDFMDHMVLNASYGNLDGTYYSGPVKQYLMTLPTSEPVTYFWYITTMDDKPVQQGEGGFGGQGIFIYHEYNTSSFESVTLDDSVFAVPDICSQTTKVCSFP